MRNTLATILAISLQISCAMAAPALVRTRDIDTTGQPAPAQYSAYHGESVEFVARLLGANRRPVALGDGWTAALMVSTNGVDYWRWDGASVSTDGVMRATWEPRMDCGADTYRCFIRAADPSDSNLIYRANFTLRLLDSPGFRPNELEPPVRTLDFATVAIANAPWIDEEQDPTVPAWAKAETPPLTEESDPVWNAEKGGYATIGELNLTPIYSATPVYTEWACDPAEVDLPPGYYGSYFPDGISGPVTIIRDSGADSAYFYYAVNGESPCVGILDEGQLELAWDGSEAAFPVRATRRRTDIVGYRHADYQPAIREVMRSARSPDQEINWLLAYMSPHFELVIGSATNIFPSSTAVARQILRYRDLAVDASTNYTDAAIAAIPTPDLSGYVPQAKKELHADSMTNVVWQNVYSNGWVFLRAFTNELSEAY